jgi:hypothetical protein
VPASLPKVLRRLTAVSSVAEWSRRGFSARGRACRGDGARGGVDDASMSSGDGRRGRRLRRVLVQKHREVRSRRWKQTREPEREQGRD